jgi:hypothetical protein
VDTANDWEGLKSAYNTNRRICQPSQLYDYELPLRYGLPCAYQLAPYLISGTLIPLTLFHPRWHLGGHPVLRTDLVKIILADPTPHDYLDSSEINTVIYKVLQLRHRLTGDGKSRLDEILIRQAELAKDTASTLLIASSAVILPTPILKPKWVQHKKQHGRVDARRLTGVETIMRAANTIEQATKMVTKEVDRESRRAAESQGGTTITIGATTPLAISISPESALEGSAPLLPRLDDLPALREMLGLPDRESSPEEVDDDGDDDNGLKRLFWMPLDVESLPNSLRPSSPAPKSPPPASEPVSSTSAPEPVPSASAQEPVSPTPAPEPPFPAPAPVPTLELQRSKRILSIPGHYTVLAGCSPRKPRRGGNV